MKRPVTHTLTVYKNNIFLHLCLNREQSQVSTIMNINHFIHVNGKQLILKFIIAIIIIKQVIYVCSYKYYITLIDA